MPHSVTIENFTEELYGKGSIDGREFSFPYVKPGDTVVFETFGRGKRKYYRQLNPNLYDETETGCPYFTKCGGCRARHIPYEEQFHLKADFISKQFREKFSLDIQLVPALRTEKYRNRMDFAVFPEAIGLRQEGNFRKIIDIEKCNLQSDRANRELSALRSRVRDLSYNRKTGNGYLKYITIRLGHNEELTTILTFVKEFQGSSEEPKTKRIILESSEADNIIFCYNRTRAEVSAIGEAKVLRGQFTLTQELNKIRFQIPFDSFFQPNPEGFLPILSFISEELEKIPIKKRMIDMFCGGGFFSLMFGDKFQEIYGYDIVESSILEAGKNCKSRFQEKKCKFERIDLSHGDIPDKEDVFLEKDSVLFLDPPRNGLGINLVTGLLKKKLERIIYISCNPKSQVKDLEILHEKYKISRGLLTDPYPHTPHLESVILLERKDEC